MPQRLGAGSASHLLIEFAIGAREHNDADEAPIVWLFNTSPLPWRDIVSQPVLHRLWRRITEESTDRQPALMEPLRVDEAPPAWLRQCPTSAMARPHWVLVEPGSAPLVEVVGSRFEAV